MQVTISDLNRRFDHAALMPETTEADIVRLCGEAREYDFHGVAVNPVWIVLARDELTGSRVKVVSVAGFPLGASTTEIKLAEAVQAVGSGAHEIDMVANIGWLVSGQAGKVEREIRELRDNLPYNVLLKVIIEAGKLDSKQLMDAVKATTDGGAQFVKTSTGFFGGATVEQVELLSRAAQGKIEVKASGGIRTLEQCRQLIEAGASRLGSSASAAIMKEYRELGLDNQKH